MACAIAQIYFHKKKIKKNIKKDLKTSVESRLQQHYIETGVDPPDLSDCFEDIDPFSGLETEYLQTKFYMENFHLMVRCTQFWMLYIYGV